MNKFRNLHLSENAEIVSASLPGKRSIELLERQRAVEGSIVSYPQKMPIAIQKAKGSIIQDVDGNKFIDFFSGCGVLNVGHSNEEVLEYVSKQQSELVHALDFPTENKIELIEAILESLPKELRNNYKVSFCGPSGSDSIEAAIKLAKHKTGRSGIIAFQGSYHGMTSGALSVTSDINYRRRYENLVPNIHFVPYSYCYRCVFDKHPSTCELDCIRYLKNILTNDHSGIPKPAAILLETVQGEGGNIVPKDGFLEELVDLARLHDIITIFDEVQAGFFRTGKFLAWQHTNAVPDIVTMSKGLGGIGYPISAILYDRRIESWGPGDHIGTFRGNQVSIAAGRGAFAFVKKYDVESHVKEVSKYIFDELNELSEQHEFIGDVRGSGLLIGIEFVKNKLSREPFPEFVTKLREACFQNGLLFEVGGHYNNVVRFVPALIVTGDIVQNALRIFMHCNRILLQKYSVNASTITTETVKP